MSKLSKRFLVLFLMALSLALLVVLMEISEGTAGRVRSAIQLCGCVAFIVCAVWTAYALLRSWR